MDPTCVKEYPFGYRCLARIDVGDKSDIANLPYGKAVLHNWCGTGRPVRRLSSIMDEGSIGLRHTV